mgnify:CR=1 FL=1
MANFATASTSLEFNAILASCDEGLRTRLKELKIDQPLTFAHLVRESPGSEEAEAAYLRLAAGLTTDPLLKTPWARQCGKLHAVARGASADILHRIGGLSGYQVSADCDELRRQRKRSAEETDLKRLALHSLAHLPSEWRGKRYRRTQGLASEHAREEGERKERLRKGRQVAGLLLEAGLPYATSLADAASADDTTILRCCRGLRSKTLEQRVACWRPLRRYLLAHGEGPWPTSAEQLLDFLSLKAREGAARTTLPSLLSSLRFLEEAGELPEQQRLSRHPAVCNAVRELALQAEERARDDDRTKGRKQAPPLLLYLLVELERTVRDEHRPRFQRAFAWYRLFRHWAALRWDDTQALPPAKLERRSRGVFGLLERTKTSGPGKSMTVLPVFVSEEAYIRFPWLDTGLLLWVEGPLAFPRDYFLPLPTQNFDSCLHERARYTDSAGFSRALLASFARPDGSALLSPTACRYWTEHSDRAGLDSWCAALSVPEPERSFLGRWAAKGSTDSYVRTAVRVVENLQLLCAKHARAAATGGPDYFGEEHIMCDFRRYLVAAQAGEDWADLLISRLTLSDFSAPLRPLEDIQAATTAAVEILSPTMVANSDDEGEEEEEEDDKDLSGEMPAHGVEPEEVQAAARAVEAAAPERPHGFVVSKTKRGKFRRLHCVEACRLVPGVHYADYDVWGDVLPSEQDIDAVCTRCLPQGRLRPAPEEEASEASASSSSGEEGAPNQASEGATA